MSERDEQRPEEEEVEEASSESTEEGPDAVGHHKLMAQPPKFEPDRQY